MYRIIRFIAVSAAIALQLPVASVRAATYPSRDITIVVPFPAGGPNDTTARLVARMLGQSLHATVLVDDRPGAGGVVGTQYVARANKDGYTLLLTASIIENLVFEKNLTYRYKDFIPISTLATNPILFAVRRNLPVNTVAQFIAYAKARPGKLNAAVIGNTGSYKLMMGSLRERAGIDIVDVSYKGSADSLRDLIAGQVDMFFADPVTALPQLRAGTIKILATASKDKVAGLDVPTMDELNIPIESGSILTGLYAPAGTPPAIIDRLNAEIVKIVHSSEYHNSLSKLGAIPTSSTAAEFDRQQRVSMKTMTQMMERLHIEPQ